MRYIKLYEDFGRDVLDVITHMCEEKDVSFSQSRFIEGTTLNVWEIEDGYDVRLDVRGHRDFLLGCGYDMHQIDARLYVWKSGRNASSHPYIRDAFRQWFVDNFWDLERVETDGDAVYCREGVPVLRYNIEAANPRKIKDDYKVLVSNNLIMTYLYDFDRAIGSVGGMVEWWLVNAYDMRDVEVVTSFDF